MKSLETAFDFISLQNTCNQDTLFMTQSIWLPMRSLSDQVTIAKHHYYCQPNFGTGKIRTRSSLQSNDMNSLSLCMSVLARKILCPRPCSLCLYVCNGLPGLAHPHKVKYSNCLLVHSRERIFHFWRVC